MDDNPVCPDEKTLMDFLGGRLEASAIGRVDEHLRRCPRCVQIVALMRNGLPYRVSDGWSGMPTTALEQPPSETSGAETDDWTLPRDEAIDVAMLDPSPKRGVLGRLGKYDVLQVLGRGGMGVVLKGYDEQLRRTVAIKMLNRQLTYSGIARRRFTRESRAAAGINHPNVVTIYSDGEQKGIPFLVMEYVAGGSLRDYIRRQGRLDPIEALRLSREIAAGLAAAHAHGVIHRDIKPGNVLLEEGAVRVKISDFGLARCAVDNVELTTGAVAVGTPAYMSPEQVQGDEIDARSDLFCLGCVMYAMIAGISPFHGKSSLEMSRRVADFDPPPLEQSHPGTPQFYSEIVARLLQKEPERRFQSAAEVAELLGRHLNVLNRTPSNEIATVLRMGLERKPPRSRTVLVAKAVAAALLVVAAVGAAAWWFWPPRARLARLEGLALQPSSRDPDPTAAGYPKLVRVAKSGQGDVVSIGAAIARAGPGTVIRVIDRETYTESLVIADRERLRGIRLEAPAEPDSEARSTLRPAVPASPAIQIRDVSGVVLSGLRIEAGASSAIDIAGAVAGVTIEDVQCRQREERTAAERGEINSPGLFVNAVQSPEDDSPIVLRNSVFDNPMHGQCVLVNGASPRAPAVRLEGNRFLGPWGAKVFFFAPLGRPVGRVVICHNLFLSRIEKDPAGKLKQRMTTGINLDLRVADATQEVQIYNNTFLNVKHWIGFVASAIPGASLTAVNNLIVGGEGIETSAEKIPLAAKHWRFESNWLEPLEPTAAGMRSVLEKLLTVRDRIDLVERNDWNRPDLLRPPPGSPLATAGCGKDSFPAYIGAVAPAASNRPDPTPRSLRRPGP